MGANSHFKRLVSGRFCVYEHKVSVLDDCAGNVGHSHLYDVYDSFSDQWLGCFPSFSLAFAAAREAQRKV